MLINMKERSSDSLFFLLILLLGITAALTAAGAFFSSGAVTSFAPSAPRLCVVVDPGHGSPDGGAVGPGGTQEKDVNLAIALKLREVLEGRGVRVIMTREGDSGIFDSDAETIREKKVSDMRNRLKVIRESGADLFLSIHMNAFSDSSQSGLHVFYSKEFPEAGPIAEAIQNRVAELTGARAHAVETASDSLFLMKDPTIPSVLIECGFITNPEEEKLLNDELYRSKLAYAIADAVIFSKTLSK